MSEEMQDEMGLGTPHVKRGGKISEATKTGLAIALKKMKRDGTLTPDDEISPQELGALRAAQALDWVYRWGWSTSTMIADLAGTGKHSGLATRLVKNGWFKREPIRIVSSYRGTPMDIITLTPEGVAELVNLRGELPWSSVAAVGVRAVKKNVVHDLIVQRLTLGHLRRALEELFVASGRVTDFESAHQHSGEESGDKIPDAIWITENGSRIAIELELSAKFGRHLDEFIGRHVKMQEQGHRLGVDGLIVFFASAATEVRYELAMAPGTKVREWGFDTKKRIYYPHEVSRIVIDADDFRYRGFVLPPLAKIHLR